MRLENYIVEQEKGFAHYIPKIQQECKPFLRDIKNAAGTLFRIDKKNKYKPVWKKITRKNRKPLDTPKKYHKVVDKLFLEEFGWKARSEALFCWSKFFSDDTAQKMWMVFPAGDYKYLWSEKVFDLWNILGNYTETPKQLKEVFKREIVPGYHEDKIKLAIRYGGEVMVKCDYSYLIRPELMEQVNEMLGLNWQGAKFRGRKI